MDATQIADVLRREFDNNEGVMDSGTLTMPEYQERVRVNVVLAQAIKDLER